MGGGGVREWGEVITLLTIHPSLTPLYKFGVYDLGASMVKWTTKVLQYTRTIHF